MLLTEATGHLQGILTDARASLIAFLRSPDRPTTALGLFIRYHAPLLLFFPVLSLLSPLRFVIGPDLHPVILIFAPLMLAVGSLVLAALLDGLIQHARTPHVPDESDIEIKNVALYLHLPVSGSALCFFIHPLLGFLVLLLTIAYCLYLSLDLHALVRGKTRAEILVHFITTLIVILLPLLILTLLSSLWRSIQILSEY